ncbi:MAG: diacylglyceryl transferase [Bacteroidetes bacterium]|nr:diacylglyceryl transferase [Bacteroidota bacterium]
MYPNLYYAFKDLFGLDLPFLRFVNTFGFFVAIAFLLAAWVLSNELSRKSKAGLFQPTETEILIGEPAGWGELLSNFLIGFLFGFKLLALFFLNEEITADPQAFLFSREGSWPLGLLIGALFTFLKWREKNQRKLDKPEKRIIRIWPQDRVGEITMLALIFGLLGAKIFSIFEDWNSFTQDPLGTFFSPAGLTMYGGLICAAIAIWVYARKNQISIHNLNDAAAPGLMLAYGVGRLGCHFAGDGDWGIPSKLSEKPGFLPDWLWSSHYAHNVLKMDTPLPACDPNMWGEYCYQLGLAAYPTPLYEAITCIFLFGILMLLRNKVNIPGRIFSIYLIFNGLERFLIEKIRVNNRLDLFGFHPTQAEVISSTLIFAGLFLWFWQGRRKS